MDQESAATRVGTGDASGAPAAWDSLFDALARDQMALVRRIREAMQLELLPYRTMPADRLEADVLVEVERVLRSARSGQEAVGKDDLAELAAVGELRASQRVPLEQILHAWRIGERITVGYARELGAKLGIGDAHVLEFVESMLAWSDVAVATIAAAHRRTDVELALADHERRSAFVRSVLFGGLAPAEVAVQAETYGLDPAREYVAIRARANAGTSAADLERALGVRQAAEDRRGLSAMLDKDVVGFMPEPPANDVDGVVGIGPPRPLDRLAESFRLATRALVTAAGFGLGGVHDVPSLGLRAAVAADADVGDVVCRRYLEPLESSGSSDELRLTLRAYFRAGMHVERTAEALFVHQNTVRYRLTRFEELTGANLREPETAFEVWWALERDALTL